MCKLETHEPGEVEGVQQGHLLIRGPAVFEGYFNQEQATRESFTNDGIQRGGRKQSVFFTACLSQAGLRLGILRRLTKLGSTELVRVELVFFF